MRITNGSLQDGEYRIAQFRTPLIPTLCSAGIVALVYFSGALDADSQLKRDSPAFESNVRSGLLGAVAVFLGNLLPQAP